MNGIEQKMKMEQKLRRKPIKDEERRKSKEREWRKGGKRQVGWVMFKEEGKV
jgi:hypothetical protein